MALVTLQRSPTPSTTAGEDFGSDEERRLNRRRDPMLERGQSQSLGRMHLLFPSCQEAALKGLPHFVHNAILTQREIGLILSESFFMVKGAALFLQQGSGSQSHKAQQQHKHAGDLPQHLQVMINTLRSEDRIKLVVRLESVWPDRVRYMVVMYTNGHQDTEENILLGMDFTNKDSKSCSVGLVLPLWSDTKIHLDGDGGFSVNTASRTHVFKPVSVQAMWSALQVLYKASEVARRYNYFPGGLALTWMGYYESCIASEQSCINEWNTMQDLETPRPDSPALFVDRPSEGERTECLIRSKLRSIMLFRDLESVTSKEIRNELEQQMNCNLKEFKEFIDNEMLLILGQMDKPTLIFDHLYLGSEWNASNLQELQDSGVGYILNVTREIDNFFPGTFLYHNIRVYDEEATDLLAHWNETYNFIEKAKKNQSKCLVHCKMGVSRSASTVIAYAMKEYGWSLEEAFNFVKQKRSIACPNPGFMRQLATYEGILDASKQRHNKLWRPRPADTDVPDGAQDVTQVLPPSDEPCWGGTPCRTVGLELEPPDPPNFNYYFRRLSDSALDSEPSTPVRMPFPSGTQNIFIEVDDVERDALLDDGGFGFRGGFLEPLEELRSRLEFSTVEEEDEEDLKKEEEEGESGSGPDRQERGAAGDRTVTRDSGSSSSSSVATRNRFKNENANNSNRLSAKRSCPAGFDDSASTGNPYKVKPFYPSCIDGIRKLPSRSYKPLALDHARRLNSARSYGIARSMTAPVPRLAQPQGTPLALHPGSYRQQLASPMNCDELPRDLHGPPEAEDGGERDEENEGEGTSQPPIASVADSDLTLLELSLGANLQTGPRELGQPHAHMSGLVRRRAERLEKMARCGTEEPEGAVPGDVMEPESVPVNNPVRSSPGWVAWSSSGSFTWQAQKTEPQLHFHTSAAGGALAEPLLTSQRN